MFPRLFQVLSRKIKIQASSIRHRFYHSSQTGSAHHQNASPGTRSWHGHADPDFLERKNYRPLPNDSTQLSTVTVAGDEPVPKPILEKKENDLEHPQDWIRAVNRTETQPHSDLN